MSALFDRSSPDAAEAHRRRMLDESDVLLDLIEQLRLVERTVCPPGLADSVRALQLRLGRMEAARPRTVRAAQNLVFSVQARLMASNPRLPRPSPQPERPVGQPRVAALRHGGAWKFLALPPPPASAEAVEGARWQQLVDATVQRALDRWAAAQDRAVRAARARDGALAAVHRAAAAWRNYWELRCEAESLLGRAGRRTTDPLALFGRATRQAPARPAQERSPIRAGSR